ncbi:Hsp20/alpha crystallin family protein [Shewanella surugensis]|uniref:Hsp20/alpha crystallin family protein n=1 Tax=Shewanella surugensis TaxID=212020 RepID=A0ABT0L8B8_9GAMM|nr:Hsp20/alpha crystallin family protein [Shewanella surugensis]MCL1123937.1 Hsp20/alpha crystallin family protein [Shewanella surugensis]
MNIERLNPWNWLSDNAHSSDDTQIEHQNHLQPFAYLQQEMMHIVDDSLRSAGLTSHVFGQDLINHTASFKPKLDVITTKEQYNVILEVPGMKKTELAITIKGEHLTLSGEKENMVEQYEKNLYHNELSYGQFSRQLTLPKDANTGLIQADLNDGVLSITIPRMPHSNVVMKAIPINQEYH